MNQAILRKPVSVKKPVKVASTDTLTPRRLWRPNAIVGTTPGRLRFWSVLVWILAIVSGSATWVAVDRHRAEMQTIGRDSAPSIVAAQSIKWTVAGLHGNVIRQCLGGPQQATEAAEAYRLQRLQITDGLLTAAQNITYGDVEKVPLRNLLNGLTEYDDAAARSFALRGKDDARAMEYLREADRVVHTEVGAAADALDKANQDALDRGYTSEQSTTAVSTGLFLLAGAALVACLVGCQMTIRRRMHRRVSPAVAAAGLLAIGWVLGVLICLRSETGDLKVAKQDAFDSVIALWRARADVWDAQANLSLSLLDPASAAAADAAFDRDTSNLARLSGGLTFDAVESSLDRGIVPDGFQGYIAAELRNVTFPGEKEAATEMLRRDADYVAAADKVRNADRGGDHTAAAEACLGDAPGDARGALAALDGSLDKTLKINQHEFDEAVDRGFADVGGLVVWNIGVMLAIAGLAQVGLWQRLKEYRR